MNISPRLLDDPDLVSRILTRIDDVGLSPNALSVEVTETGVMSSPEQAQEIVCELSSAGVGVSIDDFGTGYSSLKRLEYLPVDEIKIDRSFVGTLGAGRKNSAVVRSVIAIGDAFEARVVAEGIETEEANQVLIALGCEFGQGYLFARPVDGERFRDWLCQWTKPGDPMPRQSIA